MEENKEKTTEELLKENNELLKVLIGKLGINGLFHIYPLLGSLYIS